MGRLALTPRRLAVALATALAASCGSGERDGSARARAAAGQAGVAAALGAWAEVAPVPAPVTNNAVAAVSVDGRALVFSFLGLDSTLAHSGIHDRVFAYDVARDEWSEMAGPGRGRIAATAQSVRGLIYLFGGYTVAADGSEATLPDVDIFDPLEGSWRSGAAIPVPVDDAVSAVWRDSLIYLISGWHERDNVSDVQIYDPFADAWRAATPVPGPPVFGHAGAIAGDAIVYADGVRTAATAPRFRITDAAYIGEIDPADPTKIAWRALLPHPGPPRYRMASAAAGSRVLFAGGTPNPYNFNGIGYDGRPSAPSDAVFAFDVETGEWEALASKPLASMDHRGFAVLGDRHLYIVGGMLDDQRVTARVQRLDLSRASR